jgi:hypothetical protein
LNDSIHAFCQARAIRGDEDRLCVVEPAPVRDGMSNELRAIVKPEIARAAPFSGDLVELSDDTSASIERSMPMTRHSRVNSSMTLSSLIVLPSRVWSN